MTGPRPGASHGTSDGPHASHSLHAGHSPHASQGPGTSLDRLRGDWTRALEDRLPEALRLRRALHAEPRVSGAEHATAARVAAALPEATVFLDGTAVACRVGPRDGPAVVLRAELDGLPVTEQTGVPWASTNGAMHACGHDVHAAALVAVLRAAADLPLPTGLLGVFQPREEAYPSGAQDVVSDGILTRHRARAAVAAHVHPGVTRGTVSAAPGPVNAAADELRITFTGVDGHGAYPHHGADVVAPTGHVLLGLTEVVRRAVDPVHGTLISVGSVQVGAGAANVLPGSARILASLRTTAAGDREAVVAAVRRMADGHAAAYGCTADVELVRGEPVLHNDERLAHALAGWLPRLGLTAGEPMRSLGADDFSFFGEAVPTLMCFVGVHTDGFPDAEQPALHHAAFLPGDDYLATVARTLIGGYLAAAG